MGWNLLRMFGILASIGLIWGPQSAGAAVVAITVDVATGLGAGGDERATAVALDTNGAIYLAGFTDSAAFPGSGALSPAAARPDVFVSKLAPGGTNLLYSVILGGALNDGGDGFPVALAVAPDGSAVVAGSTVSTDFPVAAALQGTSAGLRDAFVTRLAPDGASLTFSTYYGEAAADVATSVDLDPNGAVVVGGFTLSAAFPVVGGLQAPGGADDAFVLKLEPTGGVATFATLLGGSGSEGNSVFLRAVQWPFKRAADVHVRALDATRILVAGSTTSPNFPVVGGLQTNLVGETDAFVAIVSPTGFVRSTYWGGSLDDGAWSVDVTSAGDPLVGCLSESLDFPVTPGAVQTTDPAFSPTVSRFAADLTVLDGSARGVGGVIAPAPDGMVWVAEGRLIPATFGSVNTPPLFPLTPPVVGDIAARVGTTNAVFVGAWTNVLVGPTVGAFQSAYQGGAFDAFAVELRGVGAQVIDYSAIFSTFGDLNGDREGDVLVQDRQEIGALLSQSNGGFAFGEIETLSEFADGRKVVGFNQVFQSDSNAPLAGVVFYMIAAKGREVEAVRVAIGSNASSFSVSDGPSTRVTGKVAGSGDFNGDAVIDLVTVKGNKLLAYVSEGATDWGEAQEVDGFDKRAFGKPLGMVATPTTNALVGTKGVVELEVPGAFLRLSGGVVGVRPGTPNVRPCKKGARAITTSDGAIVCVKKKRKKIVTEDGDELAENVGLPVGPR